jgi:CDGSH-type Zn-finger protein
MERTPKMTDPVIAQKGPYDFEVEEGKTYFWCACGKSAKQPLCDSSHAGTGIQPLKYKADKTKTVFFCGCKHSGRKPICDGTHGKL